jgi:hypothetical protein
LVKGLAGSPIETGSRIAGPYFFVAATAASARAGIVATIWTYYGPRRAAGAAGTAIID